ncbi:MAG: CRISPR-associated endoribonuclease Cas6 [Candidatus Aenigmarchaeota archaeon]|nr:CRISPR-associated endoribonuclease Cas6 [Candidatus Aenigmarchaeota archaeon]MDW8160177.1 CRISPR-associated endoribonuclease Cas6 [Candidatus Aenigmarchaeota archaeon]
MRIILSFSPIEEPPTISYFNDKFMIQGFIYSMFLKSDKLKELHDKKGFKYFCFSDVFFKNNFYYLLISSPDVILIEEMKNVLNKIQYFYLGNKLFKKEGVKVKDFKIGKKVSWQTGSPVIVFYENKPFSFLKDKDLVGFFERIKENSIKKYKAFYNEEIKIDEIFTKVIFNKSVSIPLEKRGKRFLIFGSTWKLLEKDYVAKEERKFYKFLLDCGLGEKNSLGFGFVNPIKEEAIKK